MKNKKSKFILGAIVGAGLGLLFAPKKGSELRSEIKETYDKLLVEIGKIDVSEVKTEITSKIEEIKNDLSNLDKETVVEEFKKRSAQLKTKTTKLVNYASKKGTPVVQELTLDLKDKTAVALKSIADKLEK